MSCKCNEANQLVLLYQQFYYFTLKITKMIISGALEDFDKVNIGTSSRRHLSSNSENAVQYGAENSEEQTNNSSKSSELTETTLQDTEKFFM